MTTLLDVHLAKIQEADNDFRWESLRRFVLPYIQGKTVLDAGCGSGYLSLTLARAGYDVTSIDYSPKMVNLTQNTLTKAGLDQNVFPYDLSKERTLQENFYDTIVCLDVIEHIREDTEVLSYFYSLLSNNGVLILSVPALKRLFSIRDTQLGHYRRYSHKELTKKVECAGFEDFCTRYWNIFGILPVSVLKIIPSHFFEEKFRYNLSASSGVMNNLLKKWYLKVENRCSPPVGLTLFAICSKHDKPQKSEAKQA